MGQVAVDRLGLQVQPPLGLLAVARLDFGTVVDQQPVAEALGDALGADDMVAQPVVAIEFKLVDRLDAACCLCHQGG